MLSRTSRAYAAVTVLGGLCALADAGCAINRPTRNGVFNENQYVRKDFLVGSADGSATDEGWFVKSTIIQTSTPNPLAYVDGAGLFAGSEGGWSTNYVRFQIDQDKLSVVNLREISNDPTVASQQQRTPEIVNAWPITNVDLKYQVNLDGERTNFFQENQELDWQQRQWVKINFAKNDLSDLYQFGAELNPVIQKCTDLVDASVELVNNSFKVDTVNDTFEYTLSITVPVAFSDTDAATCVQAFGSSWTPFLEMGRQNVTLNVRTVYVRPSKMVDGSYVPFPIDEKDMIRHKYGPLTFIAPYRDQKTQLLGAQEYVTRFDPNKPITFYFAPGMPQVYRDFFQKQVADATNTNILAKTGAKAKLSFLNYNDATTYGDGAGPVREVGDPRYSFIIWHSDLDHGSGLLGVEQPFIDPRTGQEISSSVNVYEGPFRDSVQQKLDLFLQTVGAAYLLPSGEFDDSKYPASCKDGDLVPLVPGDVAQQFNRQSTVYGKMQAYLQKPFAQYGYLGPADFLPKQDSDFFNAYYAILPYEVYSDPEANAYVTPDGTTAGTALQSNWAALQQVAQFQQMAGDVDKGLQPFDTDGPTAIPDAVAWYSKWSSLSRAVTAYQYTSRYAHNMRTADTDALFSYFDVYQKNGRHCVGGKWESRSDYVDHLITSLNEATAVHEFGHALGLAHNFMGSVDQRNFPRDMQGNPTMYSGSIMDYNQQISEAFFETNTGTPVWGPYDAAALGFIYGNDDSKDAVGPKPIPAGATSATASGQVSATVPWNDPIGFNGTTETPFLFCSDQHLRYTPLCRWYDLGVTPSEIAANDLQRREWNYLWTNFRLYHKYFSEANYANSVATDFNEMRRFGSMWTFDWSQGELTNTLRLIGTPIPAGSTAADYYNQLTNKFDLDLSVANQLTATYHRAIIEQSSGERPFITIYDPFFGDVTQQGIQLDKVMATSSMSELWPAISNFDPSQSGGYYLTSIGGEFGDNAYVTVSQAVLADFLGAAYATYTYSQVGPLANFAATTHSSAYGGNQKLQTWVGGWAFDRERDFLDFVHAIAVQQDFPNCDENGQNCDQCTSLDHCTWDPRLLRAKNSQLTQSDRYNQFVAPDGRTYIWGYLRSRNQWVIADKDRNNATYTLMLTWTTDVVNGEDSGYNGASALEYKVRYAVDAFRYYDGQALAAP